MPDARITNAEPISAPPAPEQNWIEAAAAHQAQEVAAMQPPIREIMTVANRFDYQHYYVVPARTGIATLGSIIQEMLNEGVKLGDIQITFEAKEIR